MWVLCSNFSGTEGDSCFPGFQHDWFLEIGAVSFMVVEACGGGRDDDDDDDDEEDDDDAVGGHEER